MSLRRIVGVLSLFVVATTLGAGACTAVVDTSHLDEGCDTEHEKFCDGRCVPVRHPAFDCDPRGCEPCELENARPRCDGDRCVVEACLEGFGCPSEEGCLVNLLADSRNCGACENRCEGGSQCSAGACESF